MLRLASLLAVLAALAGASLAGARGDGGRPALKLTSPAFPVGADLPKAYSCDRRDVGVDFASPPLAWTGVPRGTRSFALLLEDPDTPIGVATHWIGWGLSGKARRLGAGKDPPVLATNDWGDRDYMAPCPDRNGRYHRFTFRLYALDTPLRLRPTAERIDLVRAMRGHILAEAKLVAKYRRFAFN